MNSDCKRYHTPPANNDHDHATASSVTMVASGRRTPAAVRGKSLQPTRSRVDRFCRPCRTRVLQAALADRSSQNIVHPTACLPSLLNELRQGQTVTHVHVGTSLARNSNLFLYLLMPLTDRATHRTRPVDSTMHAGYSRSNFIHFTLCSSHQSNNNNNNNSNKLLQ